MICYLRSSFEIKKLNLKNKKKFFLQRNVIPTHRTVMEGIFPRNVSLKIIVQASAFRRVEKINISLGENENELREIQTGHREKLQNLNNHGKLKANGKVIDSIKFCIKNFICCYRIFNGGSFVVITLNFDNISMLKRSYSMEFDSDQFKSSIVHPSDSASQVASSSANLKDNDDTGQISKKMCNSSSFEEGKSPMESNGSPESNRSSSHGRAEPYRRYSQSGENAHVTQSRSIFSHKDSFVYGNPKEDIKNIENPTAGEVTGETSSFEINSSNALDLSCKAGKPEEDKSEEGNTYHNYQRGNFGNESLISRSNVEIKLVNPASKKPSLPEQLQIAKIQQQQRRSMQQQQKFLQQMRRSLEPKTSNRQETSQSSHKNVKHYGNSTTNHEQNDLDNHPRMKDEFHPRIPGAHFPHLPYPYFDPSHPKELPDNHPILPLLDPVYFSALYNAHGFLPPSSPSIAAAFIGTLQDALPKLPMMFPSTSSNNSPLLPQKSNENQN